MNDGIAKRRSSPMSSVNASLAPGCDDRASWSSSTRFALVLAGAVSGSSEHPFNFKLNITARQHSLHENGVHAPALRVTLAALRRNLLDANGGAAAWDVFVQSWQPELQHVFKRELAPVAALFEDNSPYEQALSQGSFVPEPSRARTPELAWSQASYGLALSKGAMMVLQHVSQQRGGEHYCSVVLARPDMFLASALRLSSPLRQPQQRMIGGGGSSNNVYRTVFVKYHESRHGGKDDIYFVLPQNGGHDPAALLLAFARLMVTAARLHQPLLTHYWIEATLYKDVPHFGGLKSDGFTDSDATIYRKLLVTPIGCKGFAYFRKCYGMQEEDWAALEQQTERHLMHACHRGPGLGPASIASASGPARCS
jgi:hypothetical protein